MVLHSFASLFGAAFSLSSVGLGVLLLMRGVAVFPSPFDGALLLVGCISVSSAGWRCLVTFFSKSFNQMKGPHAEEAEESGTTRKGEGGKHTSGGVAFPVSFQVLLPVFPSFWWGYFSPLFFWAALLGLLFLWEVLLFSSFLRGASFFPLRWVALFSPLCLSVAEPEKEKLTTPTPTASRKISRTPRKRRSNGNPRPTRKQKNRTTPRPKRKAKLNPKKQGQPPRPRRTTPTQSRKVNSNPAFLECGSRLEWCFLSFFLGRAAVLLLFFIPSYGRGRAIIEKGGRTPDPSEKGKEGQPRTKETGETKAAIFQRKEEKLEKNKNK